MIGVTAEHPLSEFALAGAMTTLGSRPCAARVWRMTEYMLGHRMFVTVDTSRLMMLGVRGVLTHSMLVAATGTGGELAELGPETGAGEAGGRGDGDGDGGGGDCGCGGGDIGGGGEGEGGGGDKDAGGERRGGAGNGDGDESGNVRRGGGDGLLAARGEGCMGGKLGERVERGFGGDGGDGDGGGEAGQHSVGTSVVARVPGTCAHA